MIVEKDAAYRILTDFLIKNECYDNFINALTVAGRNNIADINAAFDYMEKYRYRYSMIISVVLEWRNTDEGGLFWLRKHELFTSIYKQSIKDYMSYDKTIRYKSIW